ncbi:transposase [Paenibacillus sp. ALE2]
MPSLNPWTSLRLQRARIVKLGQGNKQTKVLFRLLETTDGSGKHTRILSNRFDLSAEELSDLYRNRWKIETFFRWIKQHLKLTRFYGQQERAVWNQIWICLIAYALLLLIKMELSTTKSLCEVGRLLKAMKFHSWSHFRDIFHRKPLRSSRGRQKISKC